MSFSTSKDRLTLSLYIATRRNPSKIAYDRYAKNYHLYISMPSFKYSEYTRIGRKCTNMSFAALNNTITDYNY